jgi:hypothetical protein
MEKINPELKNKPGETTPLKSIIYCKNMTLVQSSHCSATCVRRKHPIFLIPALAGAFSPTMDTWYLVQISCIHRVYYPDELRTMQIRPFHIRRLASRLAGLFSPAPYCTGTIATQTPLVGSDRVDGAPCLRLHTPCILRDPLSSRSEPTNWSVTVQERFRLYVVWP